MMYLFDTRSKFVLNLKVELIQNVEIIILKFLSFFPILHVQPAEEDCSVAKLQNNSPVQLTVSCSQFIHHAVVYCCSHQNCPRPLFTISKSVLINSKGLSSSDFTETFLDIARLD